MDKEDKYYVDIGKLGYSEESESLRIVEKQYATPNKLYNIDKETAYWPDDAEDYIYWHSEADKWAEDYAKSYKVKMSPKDFLDLTTTNGADSLKTGDYLGLGKLRDLDIDEFNKELYQNIFLQIAFKDYHYLAQVVGHEGRHRMFALMQAGVKSVDVELICDVWGTEYNKYKPFELEYIDLVGQFNKSVKVRVYNPIPMSWKQHKAIRPNLKDESLIVEYLDEVGSSNDFPVYITDDVYKLKSILQKEDKAYRIFNDRETYYFQDAHGDKTHYDMLKYALDNGYVPLDSPIVFNDSLGKHIDVEDSEEEGYMVFIPRDYDEDIRYYTSLGEDSYYSCKIYSFGIIYVRDTYAYKNGLFKALGDADRTIYYDGYDELTIVDRHGNEKTIEIEDDPNNHLFDDIDESLQESKSAEDLLNDLDKEFGQEEVYMWSTYILPNGHFLNPDNSDALEDSDKAYEHCDFEDWAWSKGYNLSDIYNNCIKMNVTVPYISMPDKAKPTQEQFKAVKKIIDNVDYLDSIDSSYIRDILPPEQAEKVFNDAVGKLVLFYTPVGHEVFDLGVSSADDIIKAINKAYVRGGFNEELSRDEIENRVANELGTSKEPIEGPSYILRDGSFLKIWNSNKDIKGMSGSKSVSGKTMHLDVDGFIEKEIDSDSYSYYYLNVDCIRVNTGFEEYIVLPKERPNNAQFDSLLKWLNFYFFDKGHEKLKVMDWYGSWLNTKEYYLDTTMPEEIIKKIKSYYVTGELQEKIVKKGSKWQVQSENGKNLGTYDTKKEAEKRLQQVHYFKHMNESYDKYLYHATFGEYWKEIKKAGYIGNSKHKNWDFSNKNVVCLAKDSDEAYSYCETAEDVPESVEDSGIVVLKIDASKLDKDKLDFDRNQVYDSDYITDDMVSTYEYDGTIPLDAVVEVIEESLKHMNEDISDTNNKVEEFLKNNYMALKIDRVSYSYLILKDGTIILCEYHPDLVDALCNSGLFNEEEMSLFDNLGGEYFTRHLGCIRATLDKDENYVSLPSNGLTSEQYSKLVELLDFDSSVFPSVMITVDNQRMYDSENYQVYNYKETNVDEIIKKIKRFYATGKLVENYESDDDYIQKFKTRTQQHIDRVNKYAKKIDRSYPNHDSDKFNELFDGYSLMSKENVTDGEQKLIDDATYKHVLNNEHHCEHWCNPEDIKGFSRKNPTPNGCLDCSKMPESALEEMCCDWCAMSEEFNNTPFEWYEKNKDTRWHFNEEQDKFILDTLHKLWDDNTKEELYIKDNMKKENNTLQEKKDKEVVVDGVNITNIVNDLFENHKWMMDKLSENGRQVSVNHVANVLFNLELDESIDDTLYYHGSSQKGLTKLTSPINWITEDKDYAKYYALATSNTAYVYTCEADLDNVFDAGNTGLNVFALLPMTKPYKLSVEFANIYHKLNISNESARKLVEDALKEYPQNNEYRTKISTIVRSEAFKKLLQSKGYTSIHTIEYNVPYGRYCDCYGILDSNDVKILSSEEVTYDAKLNDK